MAKPKTDVGVGVSDGKVKPSELNDAAIDRMLAGPFDERLFAAEPDRSALMISLFDFALRSLKRTNVTARKSVEEGKVFHRDFEKKSGELDASQRETRRFIEELIDGR